MKDMIIDYTKLDELGLFIFYDAATRCALKLQQDFAQKKRGLNIEKYQEKNVRLLQQVQTIYDQVVDRYIDKDTIDENGSFDNWYHNWKGFYKSLDNNQRDKISELLIEYKDAGYKSDTYKNYVSQLKRKYNKTHNSLTVVTARKNLFED